jgi:hypothetical protein
MMPFSSTQSRRIDRSLSRVAPTRGYELARCNVEGIKANVPELTTHLVNDAGTFDPTKPDPPEKVDIPPSPLTGAPEKPAGD